jgi:hypothetical protein
MDDRAEIARALEQCIASAADDESRFNGISQLIGGKLGLTGAADLTLAADDRAVLPGWFQESIRWDLVVIQRGTPILAVTYTSPTADGDEDSANNRASRILGVAKDTQLAQREGLLPVKMRRAHVHIQELTADERDGDLFTEAAIRCNRMRDIGLYHSVWTAGVTRDPLAFTEPTPALGWDRFAADLLPGFLTARTSPSPREGDRPD